jgi:hypothetical protein
MLNLTRFDSRFRLLFEEVVLLMTRQKRMIFSWRVERRSVNIDFLERDKRVDCLDFDIQNVRDFDSRIDHSCKCLNVDIRERKKRLIEANILNNSDFDEDFEIDLWMIWVDFVIEIELFLVRCSTWRRTDSEIFWSMWKRLIRKCSLESVNEDYFMQL